MAGPTERKIGLKNIDCVYVTNDMAQAEAAKTVLIAEGIQCELEPQSRTGLGPPGDVRVLVRTEDSARAQSAIENRMPPIKGK